MIIGVNRMTYSLRKVALLVAVLSPALANRTTAQTNCGLVGPQFPKPHDLHQIESTKETASKFEALLVDALKSGKSPWGPLDRAHTTFSVGVFTTSSSDFLYEYHHQGDNIKDTLTGGVLNKDTLYRIGSITKLLTVYTVLAKLGLSYWNEPVTKFLPELVGPSEADGDVVNEVDWSEVTLGSLAGQLSGISRDNGYFDASRLPELQGLGLPSFEDPLKCSGPNDLACTWEESVKLIRQQLPITSTFASPIYSNEGFQILGQAVERITGQSFGDIFDEQIVRPLKLKRTFWTPPRTDGNAAIVALEDPITGYPFDYDMGSYSPTGGAALSLSDLSTIGRSILQSRLLSPATTREWLKPNTHTGMALSAVGKPWEITRMEVPLEPNSSNSTRLVDLYTKNGAIGAYDSYLILSPDHDIGITVLVASNLTRASGLANQAIGTLSEMATSVWVTAAEIAARSVAKTNFAGIYESRDGETAAYVKLDMFPGRQGLTVTELSYNNTDIISVFQRMLGYAGADLHYMGLKDAHQVSFRAIWSHPLSQGKTGHHDESPHGLPIKILSRRCASTWGGVDVLNYGNFGLDHFIFTTDEDGSALTLRLPALRVTLKRQGSQKVEDYSLKMDDAKSNTEEL